MRHIRLSYRSPSHFFTSPDCPSTLNLQSLKARRLLFIFLVTSLLSALTLALPRLAVLGRLAGPERPTLKVKLSRRNTFYKTVQRAPMAHRQWSQDQIGFYYYHFQLDVDLSRLFLRRFSVLEGIRGGSPLVLRVNDPSWIIRITNSTPLFSLRSVRLRSDFGSFLL